MNARVHYKFEYQPHPFNQELRAKGVEAWCLVQIITPEVGPPTYDVIAIFNLNSEAERFQAHIFAEGLDGRLIEIDRTQRELFEMKRARPARNTGKR